MNRRKNDRWKNVNAAAGRFKGPLKRNQPEATDVRVNFSVSDKEWKTFRAVIDRPARLKPRLRWLLKTKAPWD